MPEKHKTLSQQCAENLRHDIFHAAFKPGERLKMATLKERYQTGTTPIREALFLLTEAGIVAIEENKGFKVKLYSTEELKDIHQVLIGIETWALELAIDNGDTAWEAMILSNLHPLQQLESQAEAPEYTEWVSANFNYHTALINACNSPTLMSMRKRLYYKVDWLCHLYFVVLNHPLTHHHADHASIAEATITRDKTLAITRLKQHFGNLENKVIPALKAEGYIC